VGSSEVRPGHPFIGVKGRRRQPGRAGDDGKWHPFNGVVTEVKEGEEMRPSNEGLNQSGPLHGTGGGW
jgi:hypothetical protein